MHETQEEESSKMKTKGIEPILERRANRQHGRTQNTRKPNQQQEAVDCALLLKTDAGEAQGCQMGIPTRQHQAANFRSIHGRRKGRRRRRTDQPNRHSAFLTLQQHLPTSGQHREQVNAELLCAALPKNLPQSSSALLSVPPTPLSSGTKEHSRSERFDATACISHQIYTMYFHGSLPFPCLGLYERPYTFQKNHLHASVPLLKCTP